MDTKKALVSRQRLPMFTPPSILAVCFFMTLSESLSMTAYLLWINYEVQLTIVEQCMLVAFAQLPGLLVSIWPKRCRKSLREKHDAIARKRSTVASSLLRQDRSFVCVLCSLLAASTHAMVALKPATVWLAFGSCAVRFFANSMIHDNLFKVGS